MIYSKLPRQSYSVYYDNRMTGIGLHPALDTAPGAWNILWLTVGSVLETLLNWQADPGDFPTSMPVLPIAVATALQVCGPKGETFGMLAERLTPTRLRARMLELEVVPTVIAAYGPVWAALSEDNCKLYVPRPKNVIVADFRQGRSLH